MQLLRVLLLCLLASALPSSAYAWGGVGHRVVAAIALALIPDKAAKISPLLAKLEMDKRFIDAASYPDEYVRAHDPDKVMAPWHFADLPEAGAPPFQCHGDCLFDALGQQMAIFADTTKPELARAQALAWIEHLIGDMHQPLHMIARLRGGNEFAVTYRGLKSCGTNQKVELHKVWDDCIVEEDAGGVGVKIAPGDRAAMAQGLATRIRGSIVTYKGRTEASGNPQSWGLESHQFAIDTAFDHLSAGADIGDPYINAAKPVVERQLLAAGIRLAMVLDGLIK
jgi:hypothetical protein